MGSRPFTRLAASAAGALLVASAAIAGPISRDEALKLAYPGAAVTPERVFLTAAEIKAAADASGVPVPSALVGRYLAVKGGVPVGRAYVDTHVVRTKPETLLISLDAAGQVKRIDVTAFLEPEEYVAPDPFLQQFPGRGLNGDLHLQRAIRPIAGATLTARAVTDAVRRVLAIDAALAKRGAR